MLMKKFRKANLSFFLLLIYMLVFSCNNSDVKEYEKVKENNLKDSIKVQKLKIQTH